MALLPEGWEADYDGTRWFYRYKATGLTQYHFPRSGDEFPELVGLGFGPLDGINHDAAKKLDGSKPMSATSNSEKDLMSATGYFDPDQFLYFGLNDISPAGDEKNTPITSSDAALAELPETERIQSPVGFVAELASSETAKCAEELAPIELDATQIAPTVLRVAIGQGGPTELPTSRSPVEQKMPIQHPRIESIEPVEEYPLVSASFAYPPLKAAARPIENSVQGTNASSTEQKVLGSHRPAETQPDPTKYETWKPTQGSTNEEPSDLNRKSMTLSSISVLQSQNSELGPMEQKRHSLSGPIGNSGATADLPDILRRPSDPRSTTAISTPPQQVESSKIPAVLQPATAPLKADSPENNSQQHHVQSSTPSLPGSGARHESISFGSGLSIIDSSSYRIPSVLKPAQDTPTPEGQTTGQAPVNNNIGIHRVNTLPNRMSSHMPSLPKINGPGIYVFQEISAAPGPTIEQVPGKQHGHNNGVASSQEHHPATEPFYSILNEPLPVIAPLSVSKPQTLTSPNQSSPSPNGAGAHVSQAQPHSVSPQAIPTISAGQNIPIHNQRPQSMSGSSQNPIQVSHRPQGQSPSNSSAPAPIQGHNHGLAMSFQVSGQASFSGSASNQPTTGQSHSQTTLQKPPSNPSQVSPNIKPTMETSSQASNQNAPTGINVGSNKPQHSWSPTVHSVSPLQSQVSSPTPSIASLHRPPSSASIHVQSTTQGAIAQTRPPAVTAHQNSPHAPRPTGPQVLHPQGHVQGTQSPNSPGNGPSKPFPMLPGQVKPMPSQVGSPSISATAQPVQTAPAQTQQYQSQVASVNPAQQQGAQQMPQALVHRPPQQYQGHHVPVSGQQIPATVHHGQPRPSVSTQQYVPAHSPQNAQNQGPHIHQGAGQISQSLSGQQMNNFTQGTQIQQQVPQAVQYPNAVGSPATQSSQSGQPTTQVQVQQPQQPMQAPGYQSGPSQVYGQGKPFNSAQATAAISDAGKKMKKWAKKTWQNPTFKQATAAVGGAVFAESLGGNGVAGAALANRIYTNSQNKPQNSQPQRPPGPQHANTAPAQAQYLATMNATAQYSQATNRPQLQQGIGMQPSGLQMPGRPPVTQNPGLVGTPVNNNPPRPQAAVMNQQPAYQMSRPPVGRPPVSQPQQPTTFSQPFYQGIPNQPIFQAAPGQPLYQMQPGQQIYQARPDQQPPQAQGGTETYAAIGATVGGALSALVGGKPDSGASANSQQQQQQQQHHTANAENQHEPHSSQQQESYSEPHHEAHSEQHHESQSGGHHTEHATQQDSYVDQQNSAYSESQTTETQMMTDNSTSEAYFAPQSDTTIINNTTINNVDNTAIAQSQQVNTNYTDTTNIADTSNMGSGTTSFADTSYIMDSTATNTQPTAFTDTNYSDTMYMDSTNMNTNTDTTSFADTTYMDASYAGASYTDMTYVDTTTMVDVNVDMNVNVDMSANMNDTMYMGDQTTMMDMQESVSIDASYVEVSTTDYSGGDWGGGEW